ncbi:hypothetical protein V2J09_017547 [Rumex salicifolius]
MASSHLIHPSISGLISLLFQRISCQELQKFLSKHGRTSLLIDQLKNTLLSLKDFVAEAEHKAEGSIDLSWIDDLKDVVYDAENTLDMIGLPKLSTNSFKKVHRSIFSCIFPSDERFDSELMRILKRLDGIVNHYGLQGVRGDVLNSRELMMPKLRKFVGRELEIKKLNDFMVKSDSDFINVVVISGVSGVGKTALAQFLYNDERLNYVFDMKYWLQFQKDFRVSDVFRGLYEEMLGNFWSSDKETIEKKLCSFIRGKRLLIVFDDVCFESFGSWEELLLPISLGAKGTTVIFTTYSDNAPSTNHLSVHLKPLSDDDCWPIIKTVAIDQESALDKKLESIGIEMARKCKGLPLPAVVLGGVLRSIPQEIREWEAIMKSHALNSSNVRVFDILRLSYNSLNNPELKLCFAYCSLFPKSYIFGREELVLLWMAEGFFDSQELGNAYFNELVSRSFFNYVGAKETCFVMHNLVHDLAVGIFHPESDSSIRRHLSYVQTKYHDSQKLQILSNVRLRTFLASTSISNDYFCYMPRLELPIVFPKWSCLRVLSLPHYQISKVPPSIDNLRQLRYLNLSFTRLTNLPHSIRKLYKLQTLLLSNCMCLTKLPLDLGHITSLVHLDISSTDSLQEMPIHISNLRNLQTLSKFALGEERGARISELGHLQSLRGAMVISGLENVDYLTSIQAADIKGKVLLNELVYQWQNYSENQIHVLDELKPHVNLQRLTIHGFYGTEFPSWIGAPEYHSMVSLSLTDCYSCISLPPLGQMTSLKHLAVEGLVKVVEIGPEFYGGNTDSTSLFTPFPSLEALKFKEMCSWRQWKSFQGEGIAFPKLKELCLDFCPSLIGEFPTNLPLLRKLDIRYYPNQTNTLQKLPSIKNLTLKRCRLPDLHIITDLTSLSCLKIESPENGTIIQSSNSSLAFISSIVNLEAKCCSFETLCHAPSWLRSLSLTHCNNLGLSSSVSYTHLRYLSIIEAESLTSFELNLFPNLIYLEISTCPNLKSFLLPKEQTSKYLHDLSISNCHNLLNFPSNGIQAPKLRRLTITECSKLTSLPEKMCVSIASLQLMSIESCPEISTFPIGGLPPNLLKLKISACSKLISDRQNWQLHNLVSLEELEIGGAENVEEIESFPDKQFFLPKSLNKLSINGFRNLKSLNSGGINLLTSLEELKICGCPKVESFPEDLMLPSLCSVDFSWSNILVFKCKPNREDWHKISHLPRLRGGRGSEY